MAKTKARKSSTPKQRAPLTLAHPAAPRVLAAVSDFVAEMERPKPRPRTRPLPKIDRDVLESRVVNLAMKFAAIRHLAFDIEDHDRATRHAALTSVDAMALLGALEADAITRSIGRFGFGMFEEEANALAGVTKAAP